uniref:SFRICE_016731 n=1 Tax=Spodoptera frugiperda TaxID=7108 RepID=A0A2H1UZW3_SPOFR
MQRNHLIYEFALRFKESKQERIRHSDWLVYSSTPIRAQDALSFRLLETSGAASRAHVGGANEVPQRHRPLTH